MIRRAPVARRGWLAHTPLLVVLLSGGLVMALSGEPSAYSGGRQVSGVISDLATAPIESMASPTVLGLAPEAAAPVRRLPDASLFGGMPATLTGMGEVALADRLRSLPTRRRFGRRAAVLAPPTVPSALEVLANHQNNRTARLRAQAWEASRRSAMPASVPAPRPVASAGLRLGSAAPGAPRPGRQARRSRPCAGHRPRRGAQAAAR
ncbi:MAG: hypothetical protein R3E68_15905 [Burkholderiaceae bacterium]